MNNAENKIKQAFEAMNTPEFNIAQALSQNTSPPNPTQKRTFKRSAIIAIVALALTATTAFAGYYLATFERIEDFVSEGMAEIVIPADPVPARVSSGFNIFTRWSEEAKNYNGIMVDVVYTAIFDNIADVYVLLQDLNGNRLDYHFSINVNLTMSPFVGDSSHTTTGAPETEVLERFDDGKILVRNRFSFDRQLLTGLRLYTISHIGLITDFYEMPSLTIDPSIVKNAQTTHTNIRNVMVAGGRTPGSPLFTSCPEAYELASSLRNNGAELLVPNQIEITPPCGNINASITAMGIIDNRLHIHTYAPLNGHFGDRVHVHLIRYDGTRIWSSLSINHDNDAGRFNTGVGGGLQRTVSEYVFDIDIGNLHLYNIVAQFTSHDYIPVNMAFNVQNTASEISQLDLPSPAHAYMGFFRHFDSNSHEVYIHSVISGLRVSPISVTLQGHFYNLQRDHNHGVITYLTKTPDSIILPSLSFRFDDQIEIKVYTPDAEISGKVAAVFTDIFSFFSPPAAPTRTPTDTFIITFELPEAIDPSEITAIYLSGTRIY